MSDPRVTPDPQSVRFRKTRIIKEAVVDLLRTPDGPRDRQMILGDRITHLSDTGDWAYVQGAKDGYCGYISKSAIGGGQAPSHWVVAPSTNIYSMAGLKSPDLGSLTFGCRVHVFEEISGFAKSDIGHIPQQHLKPLSEHLDDPAAVAQLFVGTPYLWGGNSRWGIDCSGLVQAALLACGIPCPGDSDQQMTLGASATGPYQRNDLLFWKGHVALVSDPNTLIHANAHSMSVRYEPIKETVARIAAKGDGPVTAHRRLPSFSG